MKKLLIFSGITITFLYVSLILHLNKAYMIKPSSCDTLNFFAISNPKLQQGFFMEFQMMGHQITSDEANKWLKDNKLHPVTEYELKELKLAVWDTGQYSRVVIGRDFCIESTVGVPIIRNQDTCYLYPLERSDSPGSWFLVFPNN